MSTEAAEFLALLKLELTDLLRKAEETIQDYSRRLELQAVTEHVYFENVALLAQEECCLKRFIEIAAQTDPQAYGEARQLAEELRQRFCAHVEKAGCAPFTARLAEQKIQRVLRVLEALAESRANGAAGPGS